MRFLPAVPMAGLVAAAAAHDVGVMVPPDTTDHMRYCLPNKFFEYVMAGLGVLVTDLPDMAALVRSYGFGTLVERCEPAAIAAAVNRLEPGMVAAQRAAARAAAPELSWERESQALLAALAPALEPAAG